jgi:hypothetical protein
MKSLYLPDVTRQQSHSYRPQRHLIFGRDRRANPEMGWADPTDAMDHRGFSQKRQSVNLKSSTRVPGKCRLETERRE